MRNRMLILVLALSGAVAVAQTPSTSSSTSSTLSSDQNSSMSTSHDNQDTANPKKDKKHKSDSDMASSSANTDDESLHCQIHEQLASNPDLQNVQITVKDGKVRLEGTVAKKDDKKEAKRLAKSVPGVKNVSEHLTVSVS